MSLLNANEIPTDLYSLYAFCNERYFNNELPKDVELNWSSRMIRKLGVAKPNTGVFGDKHHITLSDKLMGSPIKLLGVMTHEMLHIKQFHMSEIHNQSKYLDNYRSTPSFLKKKSDVTPGHGVYFHKWKDELNSKFTELNIQTKDDEYFDDYEVSDQTYYGIYINFSHLSTKNLHAIFHSDIDFTTSKMDDLLSDIFELYGKESISTIKTFETKNLNIQMSSQLTKDGRIKKRTKKSQYDDNFVKSIMTDDRTNIHPDVHIERSTQHDHVNEELRIVVSGSAKVKGVSFRVYTGFIAEKYCQSIGKSYRLEMLEPILSGASTLIKPEELKYIRQEWTDAKASSFVESDFGKRLVGNLYQAFINCEDSAFTSKKLAEDLHKYDLSRFNHEELKSMLCKKITAHASRKGHQVDNESVQKFINNLDLSTSRKSLDDVFKESAKYLILPEETYLVRTAALAAQEGYIDILHSRQHLSDMIDRYRLPFSKDIKNTATTAYFNVFAKDFLDGKASKDDIDEIIKPWISRIPKETVIKTLINEYKHEMIRDNIFNLSDTIERLGRLKEALLNDSNTSLSMC